MSQGLLFVETWSSCPKIWWADSANLHLFIVHSLFLLQKMTGHDLQYHAVLGKPSEVTFRYAEHCLTCEARRMARGSPAQLTTMYMIG
jgi:hypothetical protein